MVTDIEKNEINNRNTSDAIYFNFSYAALKLLGKNLYNNAANAISELVANGLDAKAKMCMCTLICLIRSIQL